jgi:transcription elongation factor
VANADAAAVAGSPGDESPGWNDGKTAEAVSCNVGLNMESAVADFV